MTKKIIIRILLHFLFLIKKQKIGLKINLKQIALNSFQLPLVVNLIPFRSLNFNNMLIFSNKLKHKIQKNFYQPTLNKMIS